MGNIQYTVEAKATKEGLLKRDIVHTSTTNVINIVDINHPDLLRSKSMKVCKTVCCWCCASGPIIVTACMPHTGYFIHQDSIPLEMIIENGSSRRIRMVIAFIHKQIHYVTEGGYHLDEINIAAIASRSIPAHDTTIWQPPPIAVSHTLATSVYCNILQVQVELDIS